MLPAGDMPAEDVSYVLLEPPLIPPLDLSECRPTELPLLPDLTPTPQIQPHHHHQQQFCGSDPPRGEVRRVNSAAATAGGGVAAAAAFTAGTGRVEPMEDCGPPDAMHMHMLPPGSVQVPPQSKVTEVRTLVVDMRDLDKYGADSSTRTQDSSSNSGDPHQDREDLNPSRGAKRVGGVLKGGGEYISTGAQKPRPRVSFLLDTFPGEGQDGAAMQIRVYAKPQEGQENDTDFMDNPTFITANGPAHPHAIVNHSLQTVNHQRVDHALPSGLPPKRFRPLGSTERRQTSASYRQQVRHLQAEARLQDFHPGAPRSADSATRMRRLLQDSPHPLSCTPNLPHVPHPHPHHPHRPPSLFSFKRRTSNADSAYTHSAGSGREGRTGRRSFALPPNAGNRPASKAQVRFQDMADDSLDRRPESMEGFGELGGMESGKGLGTYSASDHPPRAASCSRPPLPRQTSIPTAAVLDMASGAGCGNVNSLSSRSGRVREWLSVDAVTASSLRAKPRPSTVSSASSSSRSRDVGSANQRLPPPPPSSSRASSASLKAASDPGPDLDNMDLVTLNLMARRAKGPSRYRYLAKLRSLNLNTPSTLDC